MLTTFRARAARMRTIAAWFRLGARETSSEHYRALMNRAAAELEAEAAALDDVSDTLHVPRQARAGRG